MAYQHQLNIWTSDIQIFFYQAREKKRSCGPDRIRTGDLLVANEALYQLSYGPIMWAWMESNHRPPLYQSGVLPLNYTPKFFM